MVQIDFKSFELFRKRVKEKWLSSARDLWWGDRLDSRFIALYYLKTIKNKKVLDVGCNIGVTLSELDDSNFKVGLDNEPRAIRIAKELNKDCVSLVDADMFRLPVKDGSFDAVIFLNMIELPDAEGKRMCLSEIRRVLKKNGVLIMTTPNRRYLSNIDKARRLDYISLKNMLEADYECNIYGFNPFPSFPYFLPNRVMEKVPFIWRILIFMMKNNVMTQYCRSFIVLARKR